MAKQIVDGVEYSNQFNPQIYEKIGTAALQTTAQDLCGAVNELHSNLININPFQVGTSLASNADLNNVKTFGVYNFSGNTQSNIPSSLITASRSMLYVVPRQTTLRCFQVLLEYTSSGCHMYIRAQSGDDTFTSWSTL